MPREMALKVARCSYTSLFQFADLALDFSKLIGLFCVDICQLLYKSSTSFRVLCDKTQSWEAAKVGKQTSNKERLK